MSKKERTTSNLSEGYETYYDDVANAHGILILRGLKPGVRYLITHNDKNTIVTPEREYEYFTSSDILN